jgi:hypothetical protein
VVHLNFISCFKCCLGRCRLRPLLLFRHFPQSSHIKSFSRGRDSSTCSERIISSGLLTFFSGSNDYNCNCLQIDNKDIKSWFHKIYCFCSPWLVWWANSSPFSQNAAVQESVVHWNFISCFKCCLRRCRLRPLLLFRHFPQSSSSPCHDQY